MDVAALAAENCRLKSALVAAIEDLDLPASSDDPDERRRIDDEVRRAARPHAASGAAAHPPTPLRQNPLSKAVASLTADVGARR